MKNIVVAGSIAYDHLMFFDGEFKDSLISGQLDHLSVSFIAKNREDCFGGCAANIAFSLRLLGEQPYLFGVAGNDFDRYRKWLEQRDIPTDHVAIDETGPTAAAFILSDRKHNQFTIFSPAAMQNYDRDIELENVDFGTVECAIIAPELPSRMIYLANYFAKNGVPFIFDPGQAISALSKDNLLSLIEGAKGMIANDYEVEILMKKLELSFDEIAGKTDFLIKTVGENGCELYGDGEETDIPAISGLKVVDVTGCGDAFRAGFLHGFVNGESLKKACEMANTCASFVIEQKGTQSHDFSFEEFNERLRQTYS